jgi:CheY-like chemotaxis protein
MLKDKHVILCVDDDPDVLASLRVVLESDGYVVETARSGKEGLSEFERKKPDLVILDLKMGDVDAGTRLVRELRNTTRTSRLPAQLHGRLPAQVGRHQRLGSTGCSRSRSTRRSCSGS